VPRDVELQAIDDAFRQIAGVQDTFHTHVWSLDGEHTVITSHMQVTTGTSREDCQRIKREAREAVQHLQPEHVTLEIVYPDENFSVAEP
jgi:cobalt-zinc-cadmium efflux system protein